MVEEIGPFQDGRDELVFGMVYDPHFSDTAPKSRKDDFVSALFAKMDFIETDCLSQGGQFLIFPGDIFHKKALSTKFMCQFVRYFEDYLLPVYGIAGNHDVYAGNVDFINRTSLGIVFASGTIRRLRHLLVYLSTCNIHIRGFDFKPALHVETPAREEITTTYERLHGLEGQEWDGLDIDYHLAVAHGFTRKSHAHFETKDYVNVPSFQKAGYNALFLGHDHIPHPTEDHEGMLVCRGGNLSRGTKHAYQRERDVQYHLVRVSKEGIKIEERKIPVAPAEEIYSNEQIEREGMDLQLKKFIGQLKDAKQKAESSDDIFSIIGGMGVPEATKQLCFKYLQEQGIVRSGA